MQAGWRGVEPEMTKVMRFIQVREHGGPERLELAEGVVPTAGEGQAVVRIAASGVNFIDIYFRKGLYKAETPFTPGMEAAGIVEAVGPGVTNVTAGDRVAYAMARGSYTEYAVVPAWQLVRVPEGVDLVVAAGAMLQGMTAHYLTHSTYEVKPGDSVLVHAAAGGAGQLIVQMAKARGARVFGTVSTEEKAALAREAGADEAILYTQTDFEAEVKRLTGGRGVNVVYDSVGQTTFMKSLNCLRPRGMMALFGQSSGPVPPVDPQVLAAGGSLFLTRPSLAHYASTQEELAWRAGDLFQGMLSGALKIRIWKRYPLADAATAHRDLESRATVGKLVLTI